MEGDVALPVNETSVSDIGMSVDFSIHYGFIVDWSIFVLAARWSAAFLSASPTLVVPASRSCGSALLVSRLFPGTCFQPCLWFIRESRSRSSWVEDGFVFSVDKEEIFIDSFAQSGSWSSLCVRCTR